MLVFLLDLFAGFLSEHFLLASPSFLCSQSQTSLTGVSHPFTYTVSLGTRKATPAASVVVWRQTKCWRNFLARKFLGRRRGAAASEIMQIHAQSGGNAGSGVNSLPSVKIYTRAGVVVLVCLPSPSLSCSPLATSKHCSVCSFLFDLCYGLTSWHSALSRYQCDYYDPFELWELFQFVLEINCHPVDRLKVAFRISLSAIICMG